MAYPKKHPRVSQVHIDETRARIKAHGLITRLQNFALGNIVMVAEQEGGNTVIRQMVETEDGERVPAMTKEQVAAATKLLSYVLPTLQSVEVNTQETKTYVLRAPEPAKDMQTWLKDYGPNRTSPSLSGSQTPARKQLS